MDELASARAIPSDCEHRGPGEPTKRGAAGPNRHRVLVVDDDATRQIVAYGLSRIGFDVDQASDARAALACISRNRPDLAITEWLLPGLSGLELTCLLRQKPSVAHLPIIILSHRAEEQDKVLGLDAGADDYVTKPFSLPELIARVQSVLRRVSRACGERVLRAEQLALDAAGGCVSVGSDIVPLRPLNPELLRLCHICFFRRQ